jgi:cobalamin biosynthesis Mg chelatase CobN
MGGGMGMMIATREGQGFIEPRVVAGSLVASSDFSQPMVPIPDRLERFVARAAAYARLAKKPNQDKKIAVQYLGPPEKLEIATAYVQSVVRYGHRESGEVNEKLELFLARTLLAPALDSRAGQTAKALLEQYRQKTASEMAAPKLAALPVQYQPKAKESAIPGETTRETKQAREKEEKTEQVQGKEIEKVETQPPKEQKPKETEQVRGKEMEKVEAQPQVRSSISLWVIGIAIVAPLLLIIGHRLRRFPGSKFRS